ncbi:MAG: helix-turn-helix transcriptional regulator [Hyphomonadaceae bacterium]
MRAALSEAAFSPRDWPKALEVCRAELGATLFSVIRIYEDGGDLLGSPERTQSHLEAYRSGGWFAHDPRASALTNLEPGRIYTDACLVSAEARATSPFYRDFAASHGVSHMACWRADDPNGDPLFVSVTFDATHGPLRPHERAVLQTLMEPAAAALSLSRAIQVTEERGALNGLDLLEAAAIGLDQRGRVVEATPLGALLIGDCFDFDREGRLTSNAPETAASLAQLHAQLARCTSPSEPLASFQLRQSDSRHLVCTPILTRGLGQDMFRRTRAILLLRSLHDHRSASAALLRDLFDLTPTETIVANRIAAGDAPARVALERRVSTATVRTILRNVFRKTGVTRQSELAALLAQLRH